ncbi:putative peptidoglycan binding protein [Labedella gwakjiensis]|uniref:Murein L,D-transpeptidase n=1 Tax=Labedella gwakjiensis TaxID=390269 RepID=A0A2P8GSZ2_9MICO|nr:putative peptidoglycan binding protein [Labedella gwakjiensis]RUQ82007.1 murein L,D-transpeptidase [Labedella gwakjiensis]
MVSAASSACVRGINVVEKLEWAPAEPARKKRHLGLWLGIPGGVLAVAATVASLVLVAPGVSAAGADMGFRTSALAAHSVSESLASLEVTLVDDGGDVTLTGADLGLTVDAEAVAQMAHDQHPLWNVTSWNAGSLPLDVQIDEATATAALESAVPDLYVEPTDAGVSFDDGSKTYTVVDAVTGTGVDVEALATSISAALTDGGDAVTVTPVTSSIDAAITTATAQAEVDSLNTMIAEAGFYIDGEKTVGLDPATVASWLTVAPEGDAFTVTVDRAALDEVVRPLRETVNRDAVDERIVTDSAGKHLRTIQEGQDGWQLATLDGVADGFAESLASGNGAYELDVEVQTSKTIELYRRIDVDKSDGVTRLYENEKLVATYAMAIGKPATPTDNGNFRVYAQLTKQDMGCVTGYSYCTKNVPWVTYFNGDQGLHGTYWHSNFGAGAMMSHGCVNLPISAAEAVYRFAQVGTEVSVHN